MEQFEIIKKAWEKIKRINKYKLNGTGRSDLNQTRVGPITS